MQNYYDSFNQVQKNRFDLVELNKDFLSKPNMVYMEFGVYNGTSLFDYYNAYTLNGINKEFYGFDSFEGLPEENLDNLSPWKTGEFSMGGNIESRLLNNPNITLFPGWFSESLNIETVDKIGNKKCGIIHIDCDIYTSTIQVLEWIVVNDFLTEGTVIVYDDWAAYRKAGLGDDMEYSLGEARAHLEISEKYNLKFEEIATAIGGEHHIVKSFRYLGEK